MTFRRLVLATTLAGLALFFVGASAAGAQESTSGARLTLARQTSWLGEDEVFTLAFRTPGPLPEGGTVELTLYGALTSRDPLARGHRDPALLGDVRDTLSIDTAIVPRGPGGAHVLQLRTDGSTSALPVGDPGVYPLQVAVAGPDGVPGRPMLTFIVRVDPEVRESLLQAAVVLPLHAPPAFGPDGGPVLSDRARQILRLRSAVLEHHEDVPLSVAPNPETIDVLADQDPDLLTEVRAALAGRHVIAGPYVRLNLAAFAAQPGLAGPLADQFASGRRTLQRHLRQPVDRHTWTGAGNPTAPALDALVAAGVDRGVFREEATVGGEAPVSEPVVVTGPTGQRLDAVLADPTLRSHVNMTANPVLSAHRALADLALLASPPEEGGIATDDGDAGVVVELPANRPLPAAYLDTLLAGLAEPGPVRPVTLARLFDADPEGESGEEPGPEVQGIQLAGLDLAGYAVALGQARSELAGYRSFAGRGDPVAIELQRRLLVSGSIDLTEAQRAGYLRSVSSVVDDRVSLVEIADDETITLTSREGDIPITIQNDTGADVEVTLEFDSDNRLDFPDGSRRRVALAEGVNRIEVPVVARTSGAFPLRITATSPDGVLTVTRARLTVRSTVVSGVGLVLSVGALLVLAFWWISHWRTTRRNRRLVDPEELPVDTDPAHAPSPEPGNDTGAPPV